MQILGTKQKFEKKKEETIFVWQFASPPYYQLIVDWEEAINNQKVGYIKPIVGSQNFESQVTYMVRQKVAIDEMMVYQGVESIHIYVPKIMPLPKVKPTITKVAFVAFRMRYNEPKLIRFIKGAIGKGEKVWTRVHRVKKIPRPNLVWCT